MEYSPAIAEIKQRDPEQADSYMAEGSGRNRLVTELVPRLVQEKGYNPAAVSDLCRRGVFGNLFNELLIRNWSEFYPELVDTMLRQSALENLRHPIGYFGTPTENALIDGGGAARHLQLDPYRLELRRKYPELLRTPIIVLGGGPAGILSTRILTEAGFANITVVDKQERYGSIWQQHNVRDGSKNNPFEINFLDQVRVPAAPGQAADITRFLDVIAEGRTARSGQPLPRIEQAGIEGVRAGDLNHQVLIRQNGQERTLTAPIVINTLGLGYPLPPSDPAKMRTNLEAGEVGVRWQQQLGLEQARKLEGKRLLFIGLGNSTAEMVVQLEELREQHNIHIDYYVLTHYPRESLLNPDRTIDHEHGQFRVFRDLCRPHLIKLAGDLEPIRRAYANALGRGRIISGVREYTKAGQKELTFRDESGIEYLIGYDKLYTLIGYRHRPDDLAALSCYAENREIAYDFDGEIQREPGAPGRTRLHPGYFGLGAILKARHNPNAEVIPGMQYRLPDLLLSVIIRAAEYQVRARGGEPAASMIGQLVLGSRTGRV